MTDKNMTVVLDARIEGLTKQMEIANKQLDKFQRQVAAQGRAIEQRFNAIGTAAKGIAALGGASVILNKVGHAIYNAVDKMDQLGDSAEQAAVGVEFLQKVMYGATLNGSNAEQAADAMKKFAINVADAQNGQGEFLKTAERFNIALVNQDGTMRSVEAIFYDLADAVHNAKSAQDAALITTEAFGKGNSELVGVLSRGAQGFKDLGEQAQAAGAIINEATVKQAAEFKETWDKATFFVGVKFAQLANNGVSAMAKLLEYGQKLGDMDRENVRRWQDSAKGADPEKQAAAIDAWKNAETVARNQARYNMSKKWAQDAVNSAEVNKYTDLFSQDESVFGAFLDEEKSAAAIEARRTLNDLNAGAAEIAKRNAGAVEFLEDKTNKLGDAQQRNAELTRELGLTFTSAFEDAVVSGAKLSDVLRGIAQDLLRISARKLITEPVGSAFGNILGSFDLSSVFSGGDTFSSMMDGMDQLSMAGFANGGIMTASGPVPLRAYAGGGVASSPQLALFGEGRMPEAFVPLPDGRSIPVTMTGGGGQGGVVVQQTINVTTGVQQTVRAEIERFMPTFRQVALDAVEEGRLRGRVA